MDGSYNNTTMIIHGKEESVSTLDVYSHDDTKSVNSEQQLALRIDKETKPHHHLLRLLREMDLGDESSDPSKNEAVASLIGDFERDVTLIQQKIQNEKLPKNTAENENPAPLPPGWIALECPDTLDIYYANEETGEVSCTYDFADLIYLLYDFLSSKLHNYMNTADNLGSSRTR